MHGESWRVGLIRRADKEHTAAAACFITGNLSTIHGKGRAGLIGAALYTDLHAAGDRAAVQFKFAAVDGHFALNPAAADGDFAVDRLPVQAEVDLAFWHSPAPRHRPRQIIAARRIRQGIGCRPCCAVVMGMTVVPLSLPQTQWVCSPDCASANSAVWLLNQPSSASKSAPVICACCSAFSAS